MNKKTFSCEFCKPSGCTDKLHHRKEYAKDYYSKRGKYLYPKTTSVIFTFKKCKICFE